MNTKNSNNESILKKLDKMKKEYNKLEKLKAKQEDNDIFDSDLDKQIEDLYEEIIELEKKLDD